MLASMTEVASPAWRAGMIEGLAAGCALAAEEGLQGSALLRAVIQRFNHLTPRAYHAYTSAYLHQGELYGVMPKMLSFWQWRYLAADLAEIVQVAELLECPGSFLEEEARGALLLSAETPSTAPYASLLDFGAAGPCPADPAPSYEDGLVDAYNLCWQLLYDGGLNRDEYVEDVMGYLDDFWPEDYRLYRARFDYRLRSAPDTGPAAHRNLPADRPLTYRTWASAACELAAEIERCTAMGQLLSRKRVELSVRLLCQPGDPAPGLDWVLSPRLKRELSQ
jgi:hypothetical protein